MGFANGNFVAQRADGTPSDGREPLDVEALFAHLTPEDQLDQPMPAETRIGHFHLYVADLAQAMQELGADAQDYIRMWWKERLRAARRVFNDPDQVEQIVSLLEAAAGSD